MGLLLKDFEYPVTPKTLNEFTDKIVSSVKNGQSITFVFPKQFGGERAWIKFILNTNATSIKSKLGDYRIVYFEPTDAIEDSLKGFFSALLKSLDNNKEDPNILSVQEIINKIEDNITQTAKKQKLIIFIAKLTSFKSFDRIYGNNLYSLWKNHKDSVSFVTTLSTDNFKKFIEDKSGEFDEVLLENVSIIDKLNDTDISHVILHWENKLTTKFTPQQKTLIIKHADGSPYKAKALCQSLTTNQNLADLESHMKDVINSRFSLGKDNSHFTYNESDNSIYIGDKIFGQDLTSSEWDILKALIITDSTLLNRDDVAEVLWGKNRFDKYSDWAIDKLISTLRKKIEQTGYTIVTAKGRGFYLSKAN